MSSTVGSWAWVVAACALVALGCSSSESERTKPALEAGLPPNEDATAEPSQPDARAEPVEEGGRVDETPAPCVTGPGITMLYEGTVTELAVGPDHVVIASDALVSVPLAGGAPTVLAATDAPLGLAVIGSTAYYVESGTSGMQLSAVSVTGGPVETFLNELPGLPFPRPGATDGDSYYFTPKGATGGAGGISKITPPSTTIITLTEEPFWATSIAFSGDDAYFIGTDSSLTGTFIGRVPTSGGPAEHLVPNIGLSLGPLAADDSGMYWTQAVNARLSGTQAGGPYGVLHADPDGSSVEQILTEIPNSMGAVRGRLYFTTPSEVQSIAATGGPVTTVATGQDFPKMLNIAGGNLVWLDGDTPVDAGAMPPSTDGSAVLDGSAYPARLPRVVTTCLPR